MSINQGLFTSSSDEWETPQWLFDELDREFNFYVDVCATLENKKCERFWDKEINGLDQKWPKKTCWCNPPYGREIGL